MERVKNKILFNEREVAEFDVESEVSVQSALETADAFRIAAMIIQAETSSFDYEDADDTPRQFILNQLRKQQRATRLLSCSMSIERLCYEERAQMLFGDF